MTFPFTCPACGHVNDAESSQVGQRAPCGGCGKTLTVPAPEETAGAAAEPAAVLKFACPACKRRFVTKPELAGKKIRCKGCGAWVRVPAGDASSAAGPARRVLKTFDDTASATAPPRPSRDRATTAPVRSKADDGANDSLSLLNDLAAIEGVNRPERVESVLPSRSEMMEQVRQMVAEQKAVETPKVEKPSKTNKKKKKRSEYFDPKETLKLVGGVCAFVAVLAFVAWGYPDFRFPVGGLLCVVGFITYLLGAVSLRELVAEEGALKVLLFRFCPPYQWWYVATRWKETKDFLAFFVAGFVILAIGGAIIKTSLAGKKAEKSERAYQKARQGVQPQAPPAFSKGTAGATATKALQGKE